jgi:hypothetical protein
MSKQDNKWVDKIRQELTDYSPEYNAADWAALEKLLPVAKGWFGLPKTISNWIKGALIVIVPTIAILSVYFYSTDTNSSGNKITPVAKTVVENKIDEQLQISVPDRSISTKEKQLGNNISENKTKNQESDKKMVQGKEPITKNIKIVSDSKKQKETTEIVTKIEEEKHNTIQSNISVYSKNKNRAENKEQKKDDAKQARPNQDSKAKEQSLRTSAQNNSTNSDMLFKNSNEVKTSNKTNPLTASVNLNTKNKGAGKNNTATKTDKKNKTSTSHKTGKKKLYNKSKNWKSKRGGKQKISRNKAKKTPKNRSSLPFLIGASGFVELTINPKPYNRSLNYAGGIKFEKFITENSSLSVTPEFFIGNYKCTETIPNDTLIIPNPNASDTLHPTTMTLIPSFEKVNTLKLLYLDFPVAFNYYIFNQKQNRLALFAGVSNKYILSIDKNGEQQQLSNKFYLAQSAIFGAIYKRQINKNLFFDIEPYVTIPLRKIKPENYSWTSFGVKVNLLFNVNREK